MSSASKPTQHRPRAAGGRFATLESHGRAINQQSTSTSAAFDQAEAARHSISDQWHPSLPASGPDFDADRASFLGDDTNVPISDSHGFSGNDPQAPHPGQLTQAAGPSFPHVRPQDGLALSNRFPQAARSSDHFPQVAHVPEADKLSWYQITADETRHNLAHFQALMRTSDSHGSPDVIQIDSSQSQNPAEEPSEENLDASLRRLVDDQRAELAAKTKIIQDHEASLFARADMATAKLKTAVQRHEMAVRRDARLQTAPPAQFQTNLCVHPSGAVSFNKGKVVLQPPASSSIRSTSAKISLGSAAGSKVERSRVSF
jgi:hypothetical protein